ncbi:DUF1972 domain-containing protein [Heyndrickxia coagulans]
MIDIFIIGSKGIPAKYGGFETFVDFLTAKKKSPNIKYHVACLAENKKEFEYNGARCFNVKVPEIGSGKAVLYDLLSLNRCISYIKSNNVKNPVIYILACRIGPFFSYYKTKLEKLGAKVYVNPDGHEWKRSKWNKAIKKYWKLSEKLMVKSSDMLICDSRGIESYIQNEYTDYAPSTTFIAYGADIKESTLSDQNKALVEWQTKNKVKKNNYYLVVGRFVPENNYEIIIREFMKSTTKKDLVIISNIEHNQFYESLLNSTQFEKDERIKFVGTVYNQNLLKKIREDAFAYIHGHEVGGTNPSLLEALASTKINLLLNVNFNKEVGEQGALYFSKQEGNLTELINEVENYSKDSVQKLGKLAKERITTEYSWDKIVSAYESLFLKA